VRTQTGMLITPSGMAYSDLRGDDMVDVRADGSARPGQRAPSTEWQLHRDLYAARSDAAAIVHTHSLYCTSIAMLRRPIPAVHYTIVLAGCDEIPCAEYATFGSPELALRAVTALSGADACLLSSHGMVALGKSLPAALRLATEVETLASQYWHAMQIGSPHVLDSTELARVRERFTSYGQPRRRSE